MSGSEGSDSEGKPAPTTVRKKLFTKKISGRVKAKINTLQNPSQIIQEDVGGAAAFDDNPQEIEDIAAFGYDEESLGFISSGEFYDNPGLNFVIKESTAQNHDIKLIPVTEENNIATKLTEFKSGNQIHLLIPIHLPEIRDGKTLAQHFVGLYIRRLPGDEGYEATYIDPAIGSSISTGIPEEVTANLHAILGIGQEEICTTSNIIQHYDEHALSNVHCGAFTGFILSELALGNIRVQNSRLQIQVGDEESIWRDIPDLQQNQSDALGQSIRQRDVELLSQIDITQNPLQILRSIVTNPDLVDLSLEDDLDDVISKLDQLPKKVAAEEAGALTDTSIDSLDSSFEDDLDDVISGLDQLPKKVSRAKIGEPDSLSNSSPDSSDSEFGAKTMMRKIFTYTSSVPETQYRINNTRLPEVSIQEIQKNPGKYYVANFRGDYLGYFKNSRKRREFVRSAVDSTVEGKSTSYDSIALSSIKKKYPDDKEKQKQEIKKINTPKKLQDPKFVKTYKSPTHVQSAVKAISPEHGNPAVSSSKDTKVTPKYSDHPKEKATLHPKYGHKKDRKPKHRLIGGSTVFVHEASEYIKKEKADIEKLRTDKKIGGKAAVELDNEEIIFADKISARNVAGYVPLAYPNLSKKYSAADKELFGMSQKTPQTTRSDPKTLGPSGKNNQLYPLNSRLQWKLAEKHMRQKNPDGELLWVDKEGKFRRFTEVMKEEDQNKKPDTKIKPKFKLPAKKEPEKDRS